jgi:uncharacterized membrane protein YeaQ/YmgE (transglycosylase-associated protein family)
MAPHAHPHQTPPSHSTAPHPDRYVIYLLMRIPMTVLGLLPYQLIVYYLQNNLQLEDVPTPRTNIGYTAIFGSIVSIPLMNICARRFGRPITLTVTLGVIGSLFLVAFFLTSVLTVNMLYFLTTFMGACLTIPCTPSTFEPRVRAAAELCRC